MAALGTTFFPFPLSCTLIGSVALSMHAICSACCRNKSSVGHENATVMNFGTINLKLHLHHHTILKCDLSIWHLELLTQGFVMKYNAQVLHVDEAFGVISLIHHHEMLKCVMLMRHLELLTQGFVIMKC